MSRAPGFYWVIVPNRRRVAVAEWSPDYAPDRWALPGLPDSLLESDIPEVVSERLQAPERGT